jgi:hypothetical protein
MPLNNPVRFSGGSSEYLIKSIDIFQVLWPLELRRGLTR